MKQELLSLEEAYHAAHNSAVVIDRSQLGMLKFTGKSRLDLINRMSTQKVINLKSGQGAATILTTDIGRIIDRLILYASNDSVYCLTSDNNNENISNYLKRFVFFMDDFEVEDLSASTAIFAVYGSKAQASVSDLFADDLDLPRHHWKSFEISGSSFYVHRTDPVAGDGFFVTCQIEDKEALTQFLVDGGLKLADSQAFEYLRIESSLPLFGHEMTTDYIPLEANLWSDVSFNKGCYTGQEIIARMESRGRLAKKMLLLKSSEPLPVGSELTRDGKKAGSITSAAGGPVGFLLLGFVKSSMLAEEGSSDPIPTFSSGQAKVEVNQPV